ncbi:MAG: type II toxin-antitoxin system prevent-host-death family antitoxin [Actinomycetota bacterium]|nr:type II toxin-antitoxin system prevent-host-death family antitoxin [Actinomycetota bacterium]
MRELRQQASRRLQRVSQGETLEVTAWGRPVARLVPIDSDTWDDMVVSGRVIVAEDDADIVDEPPGDYDVDASAVLNTMRSEER